MPLPQAGGSLGQGRWESLTVRWGWHGSLHPQQATLSTHPQPLGPLGPSRCARDLPLPLPEQALGGAPPRPTHAAQCTRQGPAPCTPAPLALHQPCGPEQVSASETQHKALQKQKERQEPGRVHARRKRPGSRAVKGPHRSRYRSQQRCGKSAEQAAGSRKPPKNFNTDAWMLST